MFVATEAPTLAPSGLTRASTTSVGAQGESEAGEFWFPLTDGFWGFELKWHMIFVTFMTNLIFCRFGHNAMHDA